MAVMDVNCSSLFWWTLYQLAGWQPPGAESAFIKWTRQSLALALSSWHHYKHYYGIIIIIVIWEHRGTS